jgi:hypothetical protein
MAAVTREDGTFEMIVDEPGSVRMTVWSADLRFRFPVRVIQVPDADSFAAELAFEGAPVNGVVVDRDTEAPLPYAMVSAGYREPGRNGATATTGPDGRFQLELEPGDYRFGAFPKDGGYARVLVDVSVSPAGAADVRIPLPRGLRITGRATDPAGRPIADVRVSAFSFADSSSQTETMADGRFEMRGLKNVEHLVTAWSDAGLFAIRTGVGAGTTELPLPMQRAARVVVQLVTADGRPVAGVEPQVGNIDGAPNMTGLGTCVARSDAQGRAQMLTPAGRVLIRAQRGTLEGYAPVDVEAGGTTTVRVTLEDASHRQVTAR